MAVWPDPNESSNEIRMGKNWSEKSAASLQTRRARSMIEGFWLLRPRHVGTFGGLRIFSPWFANHISRGEAQGDRVAPGRDHIRECVLKSPKTKVGMVSSMSELTRAWRPCPFWGHSDIRLLGG